MRLFATVLLYLTMCAAIHVFKPKVFYNENGLLYKFGLHDKSHRLYSLQIITCMIAIVTYFITTILCL